MRASKAVIRTAAIAAVCFAQVSPSIARAQAPDDVSRADALFRAAKELREAGQYAGACPAFAESQRLAPGVGITLYLADCYEHLGRTASAWKEFRNAETMARERHDPRVEVARARAGLLEPKLSGLTLVVPEGAAQKGTELTLDGVHIPPEKWNVAMAVDPGDHVVTVQSQGQAVQTLTAHVDAARRDGSLRIGEAAAPPPPAEEPPAVTPQATAPVPAATPAEPATASAAESVSRRAVGLTLLGLGVVGVGLGTGFLLKYESSADAPPSCTPPPRDTGAEVASGIAFGLGGVAVVSSLVVLFGGPHASESGLLVTPVPLAGGGGAMVRAKF